MRPYTGLPSLSPPPAPAAAALGPRDTQVLVNKQVETNPSALLRTGDIVDLYCEPGAVNAPTLLVPPRPRGPLALPLLRQAQAQAAQQQASARAPVVVAANSTLKVGGCVCALCLAWLCCIQSICAEVGSSVLHCVC